MAGALLIARKALLGPPVLFSEYFSDSFLFPSATLHGVWQPRRVPCRFDKVCNCVPLPYDSLTIQLLKYGMFYMSRRLPQSVAQIYRVIYKATILFPCDSVIRSKLLYFRIAATIRHSL